MNLADRKIYEWVEIRIKEGRTNAIDDARFGKPSVTCVKVKEQMDQCIRDNQRSAL
jgi:hypothetical protein